MANKKYGTIGSISSGTMLDEDLINAFSSELRSLARQRGQHAKLVRGCEAWLEQDEGTREGGSELTSVLFDALGEYAPPYCRFGANDGDGADYGFWPCIDSLEQDCRDGEVLKVADTSDIPTKYRGLVMQVNDHGNVTLYQQTARKRVELWACV